MSFKLTVEDLRARGACEPGVKAFVEAYPNGIEAPEWTIELQLEVLRKPALTPYLGWARSEGLISLLPMPGVGLPGARAVIVVRLHECEVKDAPLWWHLAGLSQTASGYGRKLVSRRKVYYRGRWRRVYITQWSNAGSAWVVVDGARVPVED